MDESTDMVNYTNRQFELNKDLNLNERMKGNDYNNIEENNEENLEDKEE